MSMVLSTVTLYVGFLLIIFVLIKPLGGYMARVFAGEKTVLDPLLRPVERFIYALCRIDAQQEMTSKQYAISFVIFSLAGTLLLYALLRLQAFLPWYDPAHLVTPLTPDLAMNTAISFSTTTTWQAYGGETTISYTSQLIGLVAQNFLAGAGGLAVGIAFMRGFARQHSETLGNFWVDLVRGLLWVLLPASVLVSLALVWQGVPMNFNSYTVAHTLGGGVQTIAQGPVAALESIKNLGTNGGGFFNVNGAHPHENPTWFSNMIEMLSIAVLPAALTNTFGRMVGRPRQGWLLFWVMVFLFVAALGLGTWAEQSGNPALAPAVGASQPNMEVKEVRFGTGGSILTAVTTSNGATGSTNSAHDIYTPLGGAVPLTNMFLGEMVFGGLGTGIYSILMVVLLGLFLTGLMIGRTPEYLGKRIEPPEMKLLAIYTLIGPLGVLALIAIAVATGPGLAGLTTNNGPHGLTEILYAYTSSFTNNGQTFGGLSSNSLFYNGTTVIAMLLGRFGLAIPALAFASLFARQTNRPMTAGKLKTDSLLFASVIVGTALIVVALTYLPAVALGPIIEHLRLVGG
jgi:potassium-transporting ATPase potassium-binding subunit